MLHPKHQSEHWCGRLVHFTLIASIQTVVCVALTCMHAPNDTAAAVEFPPGASIGFGS